jgi:hypothetical protein
VTPIVIPRIRDKFELLKLEASLPAYEEASEPGSELARIFLGTQTLLTTVPGQMQILPLTM